MLAMRLGGYSAHMRDPYDVVVLGGGIAGVAAALAAREAGAGVALVTRSPGATALGCGGWLGAAPALLVSALERVGYSLTPPAGVLPHPDGSMRRFDVAAHSHARGIHAGDTVVGITGLAGFNAGILARLYGDATGFDLNSAHIELPGTPAAGWSPVSLAAQIERDPAPIIAALRSLDAGGGLVLPPVLGSIAHKPTHRALEEGTGHPITEALGVPPSMPGWRLQLALQRCLQAAGVTTITAAVTSMEHDGGALRTVLAGEQHIAAKRFVLATGKFLGGGIAATPNFTEPVLDLPIWIDHLGERFTRAMPLALTDPEHDQEQAILEAGVRTDEAGRPLGYNTARVYDNVIVAGTVKAGVTANAGLGWAAQDGWLAGERAAR